MNREAASANSKVRSVIEVIIRNSTHEIVERLVSIFCRAVLLVVAFKATNAALVLQQYCSLEGHPIRVLSDDGESKNRLIDGVVSQVRWRS
jgi:hypothetical protein